MQTFGEYKGSNNQEIDMTRSLGSEIDECFSDLLRFQSQLKIMHWGTSSYAEHKAYGKIYKDIDEKLDTLVEAYQGCHGKIDFLQCGFVSFTEVDVNGWLSGVKHSIERLREEVGEDDLKNLIDEISASVSKLKYLLTLK